MPARVEEYDAVHPPPEGFGRAFRLEIAVAGGGGAIVEEPAEEGDEDDDAVAGPVVVAATGPGSSSTRKRKSEIAAKHTLPKRQRSIRQIASTEGRSVALSEVETEDEVPLITRSPSQSPLLRMICSMCHSRILASQGWQVASRRLSSLQKIFLPPWLLMLLIICKILLLLLLLVLLLLYLQLRRRLMLFR